MVISVDTGNKMIKTEHYEFNSGIDVLDTIPGENDEVIEFGGKYYRTTNRRISYMEDKTEDDRLHSYIDCHCKRIGYDEKRGGFST